MISLDDLLARPVTFNGITQGYKPSYPIDNSDSKLSPLRKPAHLSNEMIRVSQLVQGFNVNKSNAWIYLRSNYGEKITHSELIRIAKEENLFYLNGLMKTGLLLNQFLKW